MMPRRRLVLVSLLAVTVALSLQSLTWRPDSTGPGAPPDIVQPVVRARAGVAPAAPDRAAGVAPADGSLQLRARAAAHGKPSDLFASYSWLPPPPPPPPPSVAPPPAAPPLPFSYAGRLEVEDKPLYLLLQGERTIRVAMGGSIGEFKLIASGPEGLVFLHKPTELTQTLVAPGVPVASYSPSP